jgi:hypothetical protein
MEDKLNPDPQNVDQAIKETIDSLDTPATPPETPVEEPTPPTPEKETPPETPEEPTEEAEAPAAPAEEAEEEEETPTEEDKDAVDYKKRFSDSTREAAILSSKLKKQNKALEEAGNLPKPTPEEMKEEYPEWDEMSATEQRLAVSDVWNTRRFNLIEGMAKESKDIDAWTDKVDTFITNPKTLIANPRLEGKEEGFKAFCAKETRRAVDFEDLVSAFLFKVDSEKKPPKKGQMFEQPSGGDNTPPKPVNKKLSLEESAKLMETDYNLWQEKLEKGELSDGTDEL